MNNRIEHFALLDSLSLECDGLTRVVSTLLQNEGVAHRVKVGSLRVSNVGVIPIHWWITFPDGRICDFRARMWLGTSASVPHGIFTPAPHSSHWYVPQHDVPLGEALLSPVIFEVLTGHSMDALRTVALLMSNEPPPANQAHTSLCQTDQSP